MAPAELESVVLSHPDVGDVGVVGVPDSEAGELPRAYVVRKAEKALTSEALDAYVEGVV